MTRQLLTALLILAAVFGGEGAQIFKAAALTARPTTTATR